MCVRAAPRRVRSAVPAARATGRRPGDRCGGPPPAPRCLADCPAPSCQLSRKSPSWTSCATTRRRARHDRAESEQEQCVEIATTAESADLLAEFTSSVVNDRLVPAATTLHQSGRPIDGRERLLTRYVAAPGPPGPVRREPPSTCEPSPPRREARPNSGVSWVV